MSEAQDAHFGGDAVFRGPDEEEPLRKEICHEHEVVAVRNGFHELVPCKDEVGEYEEQSSEGEEAAALEQSHYHHCADKGCIYAYSDADNASRSARCYLEECHAQERQGTEYDDCQVTFGLSGELPVRLDLAEISVEEVHDEPYVSDSKESHLSEEIMTRAHIVSQSGKEKRHGHLPWTQPQRCDGQDADRNGDLVSQFYRQEEEYGCTQKKACRCESDRPDMLFIKFQNCHIKSIFC